MSSTGWPEAREAARPIFFTWSSYPLKQDQQNSFPSITELLTNNHDMCNHGGENTLDGLWLLDDKIDFFLTVSLPCPSWWQRRNLRIARKSHRNTITPLLVKTTVSECQHPQIFLGKVIAYAVLPLTIYQFMNAKTMAITVPAILPTNPMSY